MAVRAVSARGDTSDPAMTMTMTVTMTDAGCTQGGIQGIYRVYSREPRKTGSLPYTGACGTLLGVDDSSPLRHQNLKLYVNEP